MSNGPNPDDTEPRFSRRNLFLRATSGAAVGVIAGTAGSLANAIATGPRSGASEAHTKAISQVQQEMDAAVARGDALDAREVVDLYLKAMTAPQRASSASMSSQEREMFVQIAIATLAGIATNVIFGDRNQPSQSSGPDSQSSSPAR